MTRPLRAYSRARPIRVAFLIDEEDKSAELICKSIFSEAYGRWGGRFSLICLCKQGAIQQKYRGILLHFDADIIYSYCNLNQDQISAIHEEYYPGNLIRHYSPPHLPIDQYSLRPSLPIQPLSIRTLLPLVSRRTLEGKSKVIVLEVAGRKRASDFLLLNFGSFTTATGSSITPNLQDYVYPLTILADDECQPRERYFPSSSYTVDSAESVLHVATREKLIPLSVMSASHAPRLEVESREFTQFNIVVGTKLQDLLLLWNSRFLFPKYLDEGLVDFILPLEDTDNTTLLSELAHLISIKGRTKNNSQTVVALRSTSVSQKDLKILAEKLKSSDITGLYQPQLLSRACDLLPSGDDLRRVSFIDSSFKLSRADSGLQEDLLGDKVLNLDPPAPPHTRYCPPHVHSAYEGTWAVDIDIERQANLSEYSNVNHRWRLPRRLRMASSFTRGSEVPGRGAFAMPRCERSGLLTVFAAHGVRFKDIKLPSDSEVIVNALQQGRDWLPFDSLGSDPAKLPTQTVAEVTRSSAGRHLYGVLSLFGGINEAKEYLLNNFWKTIFDTLGASAVRADARRDIIEPQLRKRLLNFDMNSSRDLSKLADIVLEESELFRTSTNSLGWSRIEKKFRVFSDAYWSTDPAPHLSSTEVEECRADEFNHLRLQVQELCRKNILHQGYEFKCSKCLHRSWVSIDSISKSISCEVCNQTEPTPVDRDWDFRLNEFLREALRKHGVLPLIWALSKFRGLKEESFFFEGPMDVYFGEPKWNGGTSQTDIDLTIISDATVTMCEVKQSSRQLYDREILSYAEAIKKLRPNIAAIAVMEPANAKTQRAAELLEKELSQTGIFPIILTLDAERDFTEYL
jgi:hypothetical protein